MDDIQITDNPRENRYEARLGDTLAGIATYVRDDEVITFEHVIVLPEHEGKGVGTALVRGSLEQVREAGTHRVRPHCSFMKAYVERRADEYSDILVSE